MEYGGDPYLANEKELTPLDVCSNDEVRLLLTASYSKPCPQAVGDTPTTSPPLGTRCGQIELTPEESTKTEIKTLDEETLTKVSKYDEESVFLATAPSVQPSISSPTSADETPIIRGVPPPSHSPMATPSRSRKRSNRERESGRVFSDVSSSESDSELHTISRKAPRLIDRLPPTNLSEELGGVSKVGECETSEAGDEERQVAEREDEQMETFAEAAVEEVGEVGVEEKKKEIAEVAEEVESNTKSCVEELGEIESDGRTVEPGAPAAEEEGCTEEESEVRAIDEPAGSAVKSEAQKSGASEGEDELPRTEEESVTEKYSSTEKGVYVYLIELFDLSF